MEQVREKQERLARLHFELMAIDGSSSGNESEEGRLKNRDSMNKLMGNVSINYVINWLKILIS